MTFTREYHCLQCEKREQECGCDRYCCLCQGSTDVRLCEDSLYYCEDCREACDLHAQSTPAR